MTQREFEQFTFRYLWIKTTVMFVLWLVTGMVLFLVLGCVALVGIDVCLQAVRWPTRHRTNEQEA